MLNAPLLGWILSGWTFYVHAQPHWSPWQSARADTWIHNRYTGTQAARGLPGSPSPGPRSHFKEELVYLSSPLPGILTRFSDEGRRNHHFFLFLFLFLPNKTLEIHLIKRILNWSYTMMAECSTGWPAAKDSSQAASAACPPHLAAHAEQG